jgi:superfamily I DNA/RNA helicase
MIATALDSAQRRAVDASFDDALAIVGAAGTGKTVALRARIERAPRLGEPFVAGLDAPTPLRFHSLAREVLSETGEEVRLIDDVEGEALFETAAAPLLAMESELLDLQIDPEVPGLRSPQRFLESAFRLARRLSDALISPDAFLESSLAGATKFYANPPNLAHPDLIYSTKSEYRNSLAVSTPELQRQYRREIDLAKLLAQLFRAYARVAQDGRCATGRDAVALAIERLRADSAVAGRIRSRYPLAFIDDAQDLTAGELRLLQAIYGKDLAGVTLAGDPAGELRADARREHVFEIVPQQIELTERYRPRPRAAVSRPTTQVQEAHEIAGHVAELLRGGAAPEQIAVLLRSVGAPTLYENALLDRDIPVQIAGDYNLFSDRRALDALALLWNVSDPFRHDWLLRTLANPAMALSDASLAVLCGEPADLQTVLFEEEPQHAPSAPRERDPERAKRLGLNFLQGRCDETLSEIAHARVQRFRALREEWSVAQSRLSFEEFARLVWSEGLAREGAPESARARAQASILHRLLERLSAFFHEHPEAALADVLADAERRATSDLEACSPLEGDGFVHLLDVESARGRAFDHVIVANARAGAFPRWYAPDAFLFSPKLGIVPKDNVGDAKASRTAKFTYYVHRVKARERYNAQERRAFNDALHRAKESLFVTAWGRATRGMSAPEFLEELR